MSELNFLSENGTQPDIYSDDYSKYQNLIRKRCTKVFKVERINKRVKRNESVHRQDEHNHSWQAYKDLNFLNFDDTHSNNLKDDKIFELEVDDQRSDVTVDKSSTSAIINDGSSVKNSHFYDDSPLSR